jgi:transcriptional antiterminator RfaH
VAFDVGGGEVNKIEDQKNEEKTQPPLVWLVVVSKAGQEVRAKRELQQQRADFGQGFEVYLPMKVSANRKLELVSAPFFPRYLFVRVDLRLGSWKRIWSTYGVHAVLGCTPTRPYGVADWVIERMRQQEDAGFIRMGLKEERARGMGLTPGQAVRLAGSPLEMVFEELVDDRRATILVSLLGRDSRLTVDIAKLRPTVSP